jgi:mutator family transposase
VNDDRDRRFSSANFQTKTEPRPLPEPDRTQPGQQRSLSCYCRRLSDCQTLSDSSDKLPGFLVGIDCTGAYIHSRNRTGSVPTSVEKRNGAFFRKVDHHLRAVLPDGLRRNTPSESIPASCRSRVRRAAPWGVDPRRRARGHRGRGRGGVGRVTLGAGRYERRASRQGYRNGTKTRTLSGPTGAMALTLPRATVETAGGRTEWTSRLVPRYQRRFAEVNPAVLATYLAGGNIRRIRGALAPLLHVAPRSRSAVSRIVATLKSSLEAWQRRPLSDLEVVYTYLDALALRVRSEGKVVRVPVWAVVGVLADGQKVLVELDLCGGESYEAWKGCLDGLDARVEGPVAASSMATPGCGAPWARSGSAWPCSAAASTNCGTSNARRPSTSATNSAPTSTGSSTLRAPRRPGRPGPHSSGRGGSGVRVWSRASRKGRGAADVLQLSEGPVEDAPYHQQHRAVERGVPPLGQDAGRAAHRGQCAHSLLRPPCHRTDPVAQLDGYTQLGAVIRGCARRE